jgi:hypothetical protein
VSAHDTGRDAELHALVKGLARPHSSGGDVVERADLLASGNYVAAMEWIADHGGVAEAMASEAPRRGLHGPRQGLSGGTEPRTPRRFVLPAGALSGALPEAGGPRTRNPGAGTLQGL